MKGTFLSLCASGFLPLFLNAAPETYFGLDINNLPPAGAGDDNPSRLTNHPNSDFAASRFLSRCTGATAETFESFAAASSPATLTFGADTATLSGSPVIQNVPTNTYNGTFPISGDQYLLLVANSSSFFRVDFNSPQSAFGFYATDVEIAQLQISLIAQDGSRTAITIPTFSPEHPTLPTGSVLFFGVIDTATPFVAVEFQRIGEAGDGFGFDNLTIARPQQIQAEPPTLAIKLTAEGQAAIDIYGTMGATYQIRHAATIPTTTWTTLTNVVITGAPTTITNETPVKSIPARFFQAVLIP